MHPAKIRAKRRRTVLALALALGVGMPPPAQAYFLDFTVASLNPGVLISYAGGYPRDHLWLEATSRSSTLASWTTWGLNLLPPLLSITEF